MEIPKNVQDQILQYQQLEQQLEAMYLQRSQLATQIAEVKGATEALEKAEDDVVVFEAAGNILVRRPGKDTVPKDLKERLELLEIRLKSLEKQEEGLRERYSSLQRDITNALQNMGSG